MKLIQVLTISTVAALLLACPTSAQTASTEGQRPDGTWLFFISPEPGCTCPPVVNMGTFRPDGTVEAFTVDQTQIIGRGEWLRTGDREFSVAFVAVLRDDKGNPTLGGRVKGTLKIGDNADEAAGQNKFEVLDVTGKLIFTANYRARAVRVRAN